MWTQDLKDFLEKLNEVEQAEAAEDAAATEKVQRERERERERESKKKRQRD